jgi:pimeloyl-ACP methyl ester carboxylesterase
MYLTERFFPLSFRRWDYYNGGMKNSISVMKLWPDLAPFGRMLHLQGDNETIFFYDTQAPGQAGAASSAQPPEKPAIILIHGLGDEADSWRNLIPLLRTQYRVLALDLPGFGRSATVGRISRKGHIAAVLRLLEETGPAVLAGSSMGAIIAEGAAMEKPDLVRALILVDGCFPSSTAFGSGFYLMALPFLGKKWYRAFKTDHEGAWRSLFGYYADINGMDEENQRFLRERVIARVESPTQERAYFASLRSLIWTNAVKAGPFSRFIVGFSGKILLIWGDGDQVLPPESARAIRDLRPDAAFSLVIGAGHLPHQEKPAEIAETILKFLETALK